MNREQIAQRFATLAVCGISSILGSVALAEGTPVRPEGLQSIVANTTSGTAVFRVRVMDSTVLNQVKPGSDNYQRLTALLSRAKQQGALEKTDLAKLNLERDTLLTWSARKRIAADAVYSPDVIKAISQSAPEKLADSPVKELLANTRIALPAARLTLALPGISATVANPRAIVGSTPQLTLLEKGSPYEKALLERLEKLSQQRVSNETRLIVPETRPSPTLPDTTYLVRVPCADVSSWVASLGRVVDPLSNPCPNSNTSLMVVSPDKDASSGFDAFPDSAFMTRAKAALATPYANGARTPLLVILDDSFPSEEAYQRTKAFFESADALMLGFRDAMWSSFPESDQSGQRIPLEELKGFVPHTSGPRNKSGCESALDAATCNLHSKTIERSLQIFTQMAQKEQPVQVLWVPFFFSQPGSAQLAYRIFRMAYAYPDSNIRVPPAKDAKANFNAFLSDYFNSMGAYGLGYPEGDADWKIMRAYFGNVLHYFRLYSIQTKTPVFINMSWRTAVYEYGAALPTQGPGKVLLVAAAGNPCKENVPCTTPTDNDKDVGYYEFLHQARRNDANLYVVANVDAQGNAVCSTARLSIRDNYFAFPGGVGNDCGSSFSAPRFAWLLAAYERYRSKVILDEYDWADSIRQRVGDGRNAGLCTSLNNMRCLMLDAERAFPGLGIGPKL